MALFQAVNPIECVWSCDQKPYLHNETKGNIVYPQKNISLLQDGRRLFVYSSNMAAVSTLYSNVSLANLWSFNCRYGDLCPKSILGKVFAMIWFLLGLVIFSVFMGSLASLLTITTVKNTVVGMSSGVDSTTVRTCW